MIPPFLDSGRSEYRLFRVPGVQSTDFSRVVPSEHRPSKYPLIVK